MDEQPACSPGYAAGTFAAASGIGQNFCMKSSSLHCSHPRLPRFCRIALASWLLAGVWLAISAGQLCAQSAAKAAPRAKDPVVEFIDEQIRQGWVDNEVQPSAAAEDAEWLRRVSLDIAGHIPPVNKLEEFLESKVPDKKQIVIDELLASPDHVRFLTETWTNLLIGRSTPARTSRLGMRKFLRENFARNRPWNEVVEQLITASGHFEENGAVNFILARLDGNPNREDYHVDATANLTRLFMGMQVQCTQCHNHPFNDWKQNQFWEFDSFLKQVRRNDLRRYDPQSGRMVDDYSELVEQRFNGPVYYETRGGLMQVAYPSYLGTEVDKGVPDRRVELAKLMCHGDPQKTIARAMVNRMWGHYFGFGFTRPIDDMGPHNPPSHPALLDRLTDEFVKSNYDMRQLARWICNSEAYSLTSRAGKKNSIDNPTAGEVPLFSKMYVKTLQAEQLYDSLLIASRPANAEATSGADDRREQWLREFLRVFGGDETQDPTLFAGTITQALLLINGDLVQNATSNQPGTALHAILTDRKLRTEPARINALFLATLGRNAEASERRQLLQLMQSSASPEAAYQDLCWALLNSNEFVVNH